MISPFDRNMVAALMVAIVLMVGLAVYFEMNELPDVDAIAECQADGGQPLVTISRKGERSLESCLWPGGRP